MKRLRVALAAAAVVAIAGFAWMAFMNLRGEAPVDGPAPQATPERLARGEYLARIGDCMACHTERGGVPYAGGRGIATPFGTAYTPNITPDRATGIGAWKAGEFWRALHNGRSRDGRLLYPVFPYPNYTHVTRDDADALYLYLMSRPAAAKPNRPHALRFPYSTQFALAGWRALYFRPEQLPPAPGQSIEWQRGRYLVQGLGHCNACHSDRNALGATHSATSLDGGLIPVQNWLAPALTSPHEAGVADWPLADIATLLTTGRSPQGSVLGPMAEVVGASTRHLSPDDARAMAVYLQALPQKRSVRASDAPAATGATLDAGGKLYARHCAACHGEAGEGVPGIYPRLAGNRAVTMPSPVNVVRVVLGGGFAPATPGNPWPFGMPPFAHELTDADVAAVTSYIRAAWGNAAPEVSALEAARLRSSAP